MIIKIAIIGMGKMGKHHYRILQTIEDVEIIALCDSKIETIFNHTLYKNVDEMLRIEDIDVAIIAVPTSLHKEIAIKCMNKNIHLFIEKPVTISVSDANILLKLSHKKNLKVIIGHIERFNPVVQSLKRVLKDKNILNINIKRVGPFPTRVQDIGILTDLSVHDIDLLRFLLEKEIEKINIFKSKKLHNSYEDNAILSFNIEGNIVASIKTNWLTPFKKREIEISCKGVYYEANLISQELFSYHLSKDLNSYQKEKCYVEKKEPLFSELIAFINYIKGNEKTICAKIEDSIRTLEIIEEAK